MELLEGIRTRRSIRKFKDVEVPRDLILKAVDSAKYYPSWKNTQTARFMLVENKELKSKVSREEKRKKWRDFYWSKVEYNPSFSSELNANFENIFDEVMDQYWQSLESAIYSDISDLLPKGKWVLDQVNTSIENTNELKKTLQEIVNYQCQS